MPNIAIITARGGSKRIPRKNIKDFLGNPIIAYSIEAAIESKLFDEVMVSTDDTEIAEIAKQNGAKIPFFRSSKTSDDYATTHDVIQEVLITIYNQAKTNGLELTCPFDAYFFLLCKRRWLNEIKKTGRRLNSYLYLCIKYFWYFNIV